MDSSLLAEIAAEACDDRKAEDIKLIKVDKVSSLADWLVIAGGLSDVQVRAIARAVQDTLKEKVNRVPIRIEGLNDAKWTLLDYGELIVHILQPSEREFYSLEAFWGHGESHNYVGEMPLLENK